MTPIRIPESFETSPSAYRHWKLEVDGRIARLRLCVDEGAALRDGIALKLNSYDLGVDIELRDAIRRVRFEHPAVCCVLIESGLDEVFCAGANIQTLATASHTEKVNFCKYTNETRIEMEQLAASGQTFIAVLAGTASGGGYELALACDRILLVDDRRSAVSLPEVGRLAVLPGTGGLTRLVDKRAVRRDLADHFCTLEEGVRAPRALEWELVDAIAPPSRFADLVQTEIAAVVDAAGPPVEESGVSLEPLEPRIDPSGSGFQHTHVSVGLDTKQRVAEVTLRPPRESSAEARLRAGLRVARELEDAWLRLRFHYPEVGLWLLRTEGSAADVNALDDALAGDSWLARATRDLWCTVLKQLDQSARSLFARVDSGSCFVGTFLELALAADQSFALDDAEVPVKLGLGPSNWGCYPMQNGLTRLETRFFYKPDLLGRIPRERTELTPDDAKQLGLVTHVSDAIDFDDLCRVAIEERASFSPDALTGLEANLRFPGPETLESKIFARLSAWQNWVFQRPNASGPEGALARFGSPEQPRFDRTRT